jgi:hypothetical protein
MKRKTVSTLRAFAVVAGLAVLSACMQAEPAPVVVAPPPPPPPPPPPAPEPIPYRPVPPNAAAYVLETPTVGPDGVRHTVNTGLDSNDTVWHLRAAWNVAALNCVESDYQAVLDGYKWFLKNYQKKLNTVNAAIDKKFRAAATGKTASAGATRQVYMTQVYNYFATPAVHTDMCNAALEVTADAAKAPKQDLATFAGANLPRFEAAYLKFFDAYDAYRVASAAWDEKYGAQYGYSQPGYVAVHGSTRSSVATSLVATEGPAITGTVTDPETGAQIPVVKVPDPALSVPLIQPVSKDAK